MKNILKIFFLTIPILTLSCTSSIAEKTSEENNTAIKYENSDTRLSQRYQSLYDISPSMLTSDIKDNQVKWLRSRDRACNTLNLNHPNNAKDMECFIKENSQRIVELEKRYQSIKDIFNTRFKSIDHDNALDFQTYCLCDVSIPYIDTKKYKLLASTSCGNSGSSQIINDEIINITFDEIGRLEVTAINSYNSKYKIAFEHKVDDIYMIVTKEEWGSIQSLNFPESVAPKGNTKIVTENICGDFDG